LPLHLEKPAIRALGLAESFSSTDKVSTLVGVVLRSDLVLDGFGVGTLEVSGSNATDSILSVYENLKRNDINVVLLSGSVLSLYNIVDVDLLHDKLDLPVLALSFKKSKSDLARNIKAKFVPRVAKEKIRLLEKLGPPTEFRLKTGYSIYARSAGTDEIEAERILNKFTLQGAVPEPVRVSRLVAKSIGSFLKHAEKRKIDHSR
jgi:endonuclease V-like protein UPF0215 family